MIKNFFSVLIFLFFFIFIYFIVSTYFSNKNIKKINLNRENIYTKIDNNLLSLPVLKNDTLNVIEFNSGYENESNKIKRNFWNLFKKND
jgi:ABC-type uncharacterized transport system fused permease/ATPase subunit